MPSTVHRRPSRVVATRPHLLEQPLHSDAPWVFAPAASARSACHAATEQVPTAASAAVAAVTTLAVGALSDKLGKRKPIIVTGYLLWGLSVMAFALVNVSGLEMLLGPVKAVQAAAVLVIVLDCVMTFFGSSANDAAFNAWVTDVTNDSNRGRVEAVLAVMPLVAMLVVFGALDGLTTQGKWGIFFLVVGGLTLLGGGLGHLLIQEPENLRRAEGRWRFSRP